MIIGCFNFGALRHTDCNLPKSSEIGVDLGQSVNMCSDQEVKAQRECIDNLDDLNGSTSHPCQYYRNGFLRTGLKESYPCYDLGEMEHSFIEMLISISDNLNIDFKDSCTNDIITRIVDEIGCDDYNEVRREAPYECIYTRAKQFFNELFRIKGGMELQDTLAFIDTDSQNHILCAGYIHSVLTNTVKKYLTFVYNVSENNYNIVNRDMLNKDVEFNLTDELVDYDIKAIKLFIDITDRILGKENINFSKESLLFPTNSVSSFNSKNINKGSGTRLDLFFAGALLKAKERSIDINADLADESITPEVSMFTMLQAFMSSSPVLCFLSAKLDVGSDNLQKHIKGMVAGLYSVQCDGKVMIISKNKEYCHLFSGSFGEVSVSLPIPSSYYLTAHFIRDWSEGFAVGSKNYMCKYMLTADKPSFTPKRSEPFIFTEIWSTKFEGE
ncbi:MAG: hypothetical protein QS721_03970 [Candidatus Endonucleobacter sp. (ex Gigantidas childressi)]|nr:hypothetical protein [Candidatus Endonucleobacter sp. (ex Gigantidas childressi)]